MAIMDDTKRRLFWHGMFLFLLGLVTGFFEQKFTNMRMGLTAHLEGLMNGIFLVALGAAWTEVKLSGRMKADYSSGSHCSTLAGGHCDNRIHQCGDCNCCRFYSRPLGFEANRNLVSVLMDRLIPNIF